MGRGEMSALSFCVNEDACRLNKFNPVSCWQAGIVVTKKMNQVFLPTVQLNTLIFFSQF